MLGLSGVLLFLIDAAGKIGVGGVIRLQSNIINDIEGGALSPAASWIVMIVVGIVAVILFRTQKTWVHYSGDDR